MTTSFLSCFLWLCMCVIVLSCSGVAVGQSQCPPGSTFQQCASPCQPTCNEPVVEACIEVCEGRCVCNAGTLLVDGTDREPVCVPQEQCADVAECDLNNADQCGPIPGCPAPMECSNGEVAGCEVLCVPTANNVGECEIKVYTSTCPVDCAANDGAACGQQPQTFAECEPFFCPGSDVPIETCLWSCAESSSAESGCEWVVAVPGIFCPSVSSPVSGPSPSSVATRVGTSALHSVLLVLACVVAAAAL
eukprot:TRINITY_DN567_c0_g1_i1.p1 TRINITY_DN567_c0_g1~~TRINITY_DN567_c0_g1_i1.p1  ORF type:complete len:283 (-),score=44.99 TRINITY_DN567_c0_g1_i1:98-841(-)